MFLFSIEMYFSPAQGKNWAVFVNHFVIYLKANAKRIEASGRQPQQTMSTALAQ